MHSSHDMLGLVAAVNDKIPRVVGKRIERLGGMRMLSARVLALIRNARRLHLRFLRGEYRHTDEERGRLEELANVLLQWHAESMVPTAAVVGELPKAKHVRFKASLLESKIPPPPGAYEAMLRRAAEGWKCLEPPPADGGFSIAGDE